MSASENEPKLVAADIDRQLKLERHRFDRALTALTEHGPQDISTIAELMAISARFNQLESLRFGYLR